MILKILQLYTEQCHENCFTSARLLPVCHQIEFGFRRKMLEAEVFIACDESKSLSLNENFPSERRETLLGSRNKSSSDQPIPGSPPPPPTSLVRKCLASLAQLNTSNLYQTTVTHKTGPRLRCARMPA